MSNASIRESLQPALAAISGSLKNSWLAWLKHNSNHCPSETESPPQDSVKSRLQSKHALNLAGQIDKKRLQIDNEAKIKTINLALRSDSSLGSSLIRIQPKTDF